MPNKKNNLTIFQSLRKVISGSNDIQSAVKAVNSYGVDDTDILFKTGDRNEYEKQLLQMKQQNAISKQWKRAKFDLANRSLAGLTDVKMMYRDVDLMDGMYGFPEIGTALDVVMEESCFIRKKFLVNVESKSERVKSILEDLLVNRLQINVMLPMICRAMCKYGNSFMLLDINTENGVMNWKQLPVYEIERFEAGMDNPYAYAYTNINSNNLNSDDTTKFVWVGQHEFVPYQNWQVAHFRLLYDSIFLPYGCLVGDTRIETENGYKEMSKIEIGDKVWTFNVNSQERELGEVTMFMPKGVKEVFRVSTVHNEIEGTNDHKLLTYNGNDLSYKEIKDIQVGDLLVIDNSYNKQNKKITIDKSYPTEKEANLHKSMVWWNNFIQYIPDYVDEEFAKFFGFMIGDGWITNNKHIYFATGEYEKFNLDFAKYINKITNHSYKFIKPFRSTNGKYEYTSCVIASKCLSLVLHRMGFIDGFDKKRIPAWVFESSDNIKKAFLNGLMIADGSYNIDKYGVLRCSIEMSNEQLIKDVKTLVQSIGYKSSKVCSRNRVGKRTELKNGYDIIVKNVSYYFYFYESLNTQEKKYDIHHRLKEGFKTEKVRKIEYVGEKQTYDFTVNNNNSNFFANGIVTHNCSFLHKARRAWRMLSMMEDMMLIYRLERSVERRVFKINVGNMNEDDIPAHIEEIANDFKRTPIIDPMTGQLDLKKNILNVAEDYFIPVRDDNAATPIDTLQGAQNMTAIDDIKFMQAKLVTALRVPKPFLNYEDSTGDGKNLSLLDVRFMRTVNRIQQALLMELNKVCIIHLYMLGFEDELTNFSLSMNNPSSQVEMMEIDNLAKKITTAKDATAENGEGGLPLMSMMRAWKEIMGWSDAEIKENLEQMRLEKALGMELLKTPEIIKKTGLFDPVDNIYGEPGAEYSEGNPNEEGGAGGGFGGGGGSFGGGAPVGDEDFDFGEEEGEEMGAEGEMDMNAAAEEEGAAPAEGEQPMGESTKMLKNLLVEMRGEKPTRKIVKKKRKANESLNNVPIFQKSFLINKDLNSMVNRLETIMAESGKSDDVFEKKTFKKEEVLGD